MSLELPESPSTPGPPPQEPRGKAKGLLGGLLAALAAGWKFLLAGAKFLVPLLKFGKLGKVLLTGGTMLLSIWYYAQFFGASFAIGFVLCILVHELGHVVFAKKAGLPVSAPVFIPGLGAMILLKRTPRNSWVDAYVGIGGPLFGTLAGLFCWAVFWLTGNYLFLGLAYAAFFLNLFNLTPIYPLDGGRIVGAVSKWIWVAGFGGMLLMTILGVVRNPFIWILILMGIPTMWSRFRKGGEAQLAATPEQRLIMGVSYVALAGFLFWGMTAVQLDVRTRLHPRRSSAVAVILPRHKRA